jgi:hypothetical protein
VTAERSFTIGAKDVAKLIRHDRSAGWFYAHRASLERAGFPKKDPLLGGWSRPAVELWLAKRAGTVAESADDQERQAMREAINAQRTRRHAVRHQPTR